MQWSMWPVEEQPGQVASGVEKSRRDAVRQQRAALQCNLRAAGLCKKPTSGWQVKRKAGRGSEGLEGPVVRIAKTF